jgi:hypothetical protein
MIYVYSELNIVLDSCRHLIFFENPEFVTIIFQVSHYGLYSLACLLHTLSTFQEFELCLNFAY